MVTSETTATSRNSGTSGFSGNSRSSPEIEPDINPEETPPTGESQLSNDDEGNQKDSKAETKESKKTRREEKEDTSTGPASMRLILDFLENQTNERSPEEPVGLPDLDDAIISQASLPPDGLLWTEPSGGVERHRAADAIEIDSYITSLQQLQEPLAEPQGLPNPDNALIEEATSANLISSRPEEADHTCVCICNRRRRRREEPEEGAGVGKGEKKRFAGKIMNLTLI